MSESTDIPQQEYPAVVNDQLILTCGCRYTADDNCQCVHEEADLNAIEQFWLNMTPTTPKQTENKLAVVKMVAEKQALEQQAVNDAHGIKPHMSTMGTKDIISALVPLLAQLANPQAEPLRTDRTLQKQQVRRTGVMVDTSEVESHEFIGFSLFPKALSHAMELPIIGVRVHIPSFNYDPKAYISAMILNLKLGVAAAQDAEFTGEPEIDHSSH